MLIQTDNATYTVDLSIEILLPTATSTPYEDFPHSRAKPSEEDTVNHATGSLFVASIALKILAI